MKGIILAGGYGNRLKPLTSITNKHLLPVYNKPMVMYPLELLLRAGIKDILIVAGTDHAGGFLKLLGSGSKFDASIQYECQDEPLGIAHALNLAKDFCGDEPMTVILGDNIFEEDVSNYIKSFDEGGKIFLKEVDDANRFGVAEIDDQMNVLNIEEKPKNPKSSYAVTGLYIFDHTVFDIIQTLEPSARGELEITDVNNAYIEKGQMKAHILEKRWTDAGTFESLFKANQVARESFLQLQQNV